MSPDGRDLAVSGEGGVAMLDPRTGALRRQMEVEPGDSSAYYLSFSDDSRRVATVISANRETLVWDVASGRLLARLPLNDAGEFTDLAATGSSVYTAGSDNALRQWDVDGGRRFIAAAAHVPSHTFDFSFVRPSPGGRFIAYAQGGNHVVFFDVRNGTLGEPLWLGPKDGYRPQPTARWHPDGIHFAVAVNGRIRVWNARTDTLTASAKPLGPDVTAIDFSNDGSRLVVGQLSGQVSMLDATDLRPVGRPVKLDQSVRDVAAGPDDRTAIALVGYVNPSGFFGGRVSDWADVDLATGSVLASGDLGVDSGPLDISPDGRHVAIAVDDGALLLLDLDTGQPVREPVGIHDNLLFVTYSPDGSRVLTSGDDASNGLFDGNTGELLARVVTPQRVTEAGFGTDPWSVLIAPLFGGTVYEWDSRPDRAIAFACRIAGRDFTEAEWAENFGDRPYQHVCPQPDAT